MKKVLSAVMCLLLLTGLFAIPVSAVETYQLVLDYVVSADRTVTVKTKIENGSAAPYTRVELRVDGQTLQELDSGGSYTCVFDEPVPAQVSEVLLVTETYSSTGYTFKGTIVDITHEFGVVTVDTEVSEIEGAGEIVAAASGATLDDATAKLSVDVEKALATVSGSSVQEWMAYASLTMDRRIYDARFADVMGQVHFELTYASALDRVESYVAAKNSHADFMQYNDDEVWGVALDLNFVSVYGDERVWIDMQDDTTSRYTVTLPIPKKLVDCHAYAVAYFDEEGNATLEPVAIQNNVLTVTVNGVAPMAIVGMGTNADVVVSQEGATVNGTRVELPVDVDRALESDFGTTAEVLMDKVVFWMHKSDYDRLVDPAVAALHLEIRSASHYVTDDMLIAAKNNDVRYNVYTDEQVKGIALDVRLMYLSDQMHAAISSGKGGTASIEFDMQIPVPAALSSCEVITVAMVNEKGITMLIPVVQEGGMITLPSTISLGKIVLIGLGTANATAPSKVSFFDMFLSLDQMPVWVLLMMIVGVLLVIAGIVVLVMVTFRKKAEAKLAAKRKENDEGARIMIRPVEDEEIEPNQELTSDMIVPSVLADSDEHLDLDDDEREHYRAKSALDQETFDRISRQSVSPAKQISRNQMKTIREGVEPQKSTQKERVSVDDLLDELNDNLKRLDKHE